MSAIQLQINLRYLRNRKGLTQTQVCQCAGVSRANYSHWETGFCDMPLNVFENFAQLYGVMIDDLVREDLTNINKINETWYKNIKN